MNLDDLLGAVDWIDRAWSYVGPLLAGYSPGQLVEFRVWIAGRGPQPAPPGAACAENISRHLRRYGVRCWRRGFTARQIVLVVPARQARWAEWLAPRDAAGYVRLRHPKIR